MEAVRQRVAPSFLQSVRRTAFSVLQIHTKIYFKQRCSTVNHDVQKYFWLNCRFQILSPGNFEEFLQKLDPLCFTYHQVDCFYTLFKYRFSGNFVVKIGQVFVNLQGTVYFNQRDGRVNRMPSIVRKRRLRKTYRKH